MSLILALDQGTTSSRALVFDDRLQVRASAQREFAQHFPQPGWVEHDADEIWQSQLAVAQDALHQADIVPGDLAAIGITNQRETVVAWDADTGKPLHRALVWQDRRTEPWCARLRAEGHEDLVRARTGLVLDPYFSASKIRWLLDHSEPVRTAAAAGRLRVGTVDSWLVWNLTSGRHHITDATNAARTMLYNIHEGRWDPDLLALWDVPGSILPEVVDSAGMLAMADVFHGASIPIGGIAGDQQAALFGQACFSPGMAKCTYGTGSFILVNTGPTPTVSANRLLTTVASSIGGRIDYALEGSVFVTGAVVQWLRDGLGLIEKAADVEALAASVPDSDGVVFVPAFTGLGAPYWDADARGAIVGMSRGTNRGHIARAALESIALQVDDVARSMIADTGQALRELRVDGGATANALLMQIQADLLGVPLLRPGNQESTALGAAALAGVGIELWDQAQLATHWQLDHRFEPAADPADVARLRRHWVAAVARARGWTRAVDAAADDDQLRS